MSNDLTIFENEQFGKVRVIMKEGEPWFVAKDVCEILQTRTNDTLNALDDDEKGYDSIVSPGGPQQFAVLSESGLYSCVLRSRKPEAKQFKRWVTHEVLPSIRKTGSYSVVSVDQHVLIALGELNNKLDQLAIENQEIKEQLQELAPKAEFYDAVTQSDQTYDVGDAAKILGKCGRNTLFKVLKQKNILMQNRSPYQRFVNNGMFKVVVDENSLYSKTVVTGKGLQHIKKILD